MVCTVGVVVHMVCGTHDAMSRDTQGDHNVEVVRRFTELLFDEVLEGCVNGRVASEGGTV